MPLSFLNKNNVKLKYLKKNYAQNNLRKALDEILIHTEKLITEAGKYKKKIKNKKLSRETDFILEIAKKLLKLLKEKDPLKEKVVLSKFDYIKCFIKTFF